MSVIRIQECEMCGRSRKLAKDDQEDLGGWRKLSSGNKEVTICQVDMSLIVEHALQRSQVRDTTPNEWNGSPLLLQFWESTKEARVST